ncbi:MAG: MFS transporter [Chloroflexota bacterium]|nr:MFS transporter [Chloroflexota bacterium]
MRFVSTWTGRLGDAVGMPWVRTVAVLSIAQVVSELAFSFALPFTPLYIQELGVPDATEAGLWAGFMAGVFAVAMGGMAPVWGVLADRYGHRRMIQRAFFGAGAAIAGMALAQTPEQLLILRILHGALTGVVTAMATLVSLTAPRQYLATSLGLMQAAVFLGISLGPLLGGAFADRFGLRASFGATGAILCTTGLLVTLLVREPAREKPRIGKEAAVAGSRDRLVSRELFAVVSLMAIVRFATMAPQPVLPLFVQQLVDTPEGLGTTVGVVLAATGIASTVSALLVGRLTDRHGQRATLLACFALAAALSPLHYLIGSVWHLVLLRTAMGLALGGTGPAIQALLIDVTPAGRRGAAFGLLTTANALGNGGGPVVGSVVAAGYGVPAVFVATMPTYAIAGWVLGRLRPQAARDVEDR